MIRRSAVSWIVLGICLEALACASQQPGESRTIRARGDYPHKGSGLVLPARIGLLDRKLIREFNGDPDDLAASYSSIRPEDPIQVAVYFSPAGQAFTGRLKQQFTQRLSELRRGPRGRSPLETRVVRAPGGTGRAIGYEASYRGGTEKDPVRTLLRVFQCGQWFFRIHASTVEKEAAALATTVDDFQTVLSCEQMADHSPAGDALDVSIEPGVAGRPEWRAYAQGQVDWLRRNVSPGILALGIPDHDLQLFLAAWNRALDARRGQSAPVPDPLFDALERARQASFLDEYLWTEHLGFLSPPLELDLESYRAWRAQLDITAAYQIRAGAVVVRSAESTAR
jgi:hypothetical protein